MGKSTISMAIFNSFLLVYQRVSNLIQGSAVNPGSRMSWAQVSIQEPPEQLGPKKIDA